MTKPKGGGRKPVGTVVRTRDRRWQGMITLADGSRTRLPPFENSQSWSRAKAKEALAAKLERNPEWLEIKRPAIAAEPSSAGEKWWSKFFLYRESKGLTPTESMYSAHIQPVLKGKHPEHWTSDDCEAVRDAIDQKIATGYWVMTTPDGKRRKYRFGWKRGANIWALFTSACKAAARSKNRELRVRKDNPCKDIEPPDRGAHKQKQWLWPTEFVQLAACQDVPKRWRILYTLLTYTYLRPNELAALVADKDVQLKIGLLKVTKAWDFDKAEPKDHPKTSAGVRNVPIEAPIVGLLETLTAGCNPGDLLVPNLPPPEDWAATFRDHLRRAGITRAELFEDTPTSKQITLYDLRGTGITWRTLRRDDPRAIQQAAGHERYSTTESYVREAEIYQDRDIGKPFPPLPPGLLTERIARGKRTMVTQVHEIIASPRGFERDAAAPISEENQGIAQGEGSEPSTSGEANHAIPEPRAIDRVRNDDPSDPIETALADAITKASAAEQWTTVEVLSRELTARREARARVIPLDAARARRGSK